jgi:hypothetical protein
LINLTFILLQRDAFKWAGRINPIGGAIGAAVFQVEINTQKAKLNVLQYELSAYEKSADEADKKYLEANSTMKILTEVSREFPKMSSSLLQAKDSHCRTTEFSPKQNNPCLRSKTAISPT